ncbi:MAG: 3'-5' exonuclease [Alphaproteobacteria bacterium]
MHTKADNAKIKVVSTYNGEEEAQFVVDEVSSLVRDGYQYSDMAVLVRTAAQTREFEEKFISEAIPYQVIGGLKFYERAGNPRRVGLFQGGLAASRRLGVRTHYQ